MPIKFKVVKDEPKLAASRGNRQREYDEVIERAKGLRSGEMLMIEEADYHARRKIRLGVDARIRLNRLQLRLRERDGKLYIRAEQRKWPGKRD